MPSTSTARFEHTRRSQPRETHTPPPKQGPTTTTSHSTSVSSVVSTPTRDREPSSRFAPAHSNYGSPRPSPRTERDEVDRALHHFQAGNYEQALDGAQSYVRRAHGDPHADSQLINSANSLITTCELKLRPQNPPTPIPSTRPPRLGQLKLGNIGNMQGSPAAAATTTTSTFGTHSPPSTTTHIVPFNNATEGPGLGTTTTTTTTTMSIASFGAESPSASPRGDGSPRGFGASSNYSPTSTSYGNSAANEDWKQRFKEVERRLKQERSDWARREQDLQAQVQRERDHIHDYENDRARIDREAEERRLARENGVIKSLQDQISSQQQQIKDLASQHANAIAELAALKSQWDRERQVLHDEAAARNQRLVDLNQAFAEQSDALRDSELARQKEADRAGQLERELADCQNSKKHALVSLESRVKSLEDERDDLLSQRDSLQADFDNANNELESLRLQHQRAEAELRVEVTHLQTTVHTVTSDKERLQREIEALQAHREDLAKEQERLAKDLLESHETMSKIRADLEKEKQLAKQRLDLLNAAQSQVTDLSGERDRLRGEMAALERQLQLAQRELADNQKNVSQLRSEIDSLKHDLQHERELRIQDAKMREQQEAASLAEIHRLQDQMRNLEQEFGLERQSLQNEVSQLKSEADRLRWMLEQWKKERLEFDRRTDALNDDSRNPTSP